METLHEKNVINTSEKYSSTDTINIINVYYTVKVIFLLRLY